MFKNLRWGAVSITGNFRDNNEDCYLVDPDERFFIVADGMGGQSAGEKASAMAVELIPQKLHQLIDFETATAEQVKASIDQAVSYANVEIMALAELDVNFHNMGTTLTLIVVVRDSLFLAGVGDSRIYQLHGDQFQQLTVDHSLTNALLQAGTITKDEAANHRFRNVLYRYLGTKEGSAGAEVQQVVIQRGDRYIMCSDGVTEGVSDEELAAILKQHDDPQDVAQQSVETAQRGGSRDNITCLVLYVD